MPRPARLGNLLLLGDMNSRHTQLGGTQCNKNGPHLLNYIDINEFTIYSPNEPTHILGGRLDYSMGFGLDTSRVKCKLVYELTSDHTAIITEYTLPLQVDGIHRQKRKKLYIPYRLHGTFLAYVGRWYEGYEVHDSQSFYKDLVTVIDEFYNSKVVAGTGTRLCNKRNVKGGKKRFCWYQNNDLQTHSNFVHEAGNIYREERTPENLKLFLNTIKDFREKKNEKRQEYWNNFLDGINHQTSSKEIWHKIARVKGKKFKMPRHHAPIQQANRLVNQWSTASSHKNLPANVRRELGKERINRNFRLEIGCSEKDVCDEYPITSYELGNVLLKGKATSPGEDGVTYSTLRLLARVPGNPLLRLYNLSLDEGVLPGEWTYSVIVPTPKGQTDKFRPISLTSCFCKVMERILLTRLMYRIGPQLSPRLNGFLPGSGVQQCVGSYLANLEGDTFTVFIDLKSAFDVANREIILDEIIKMGIKGKLLTWIRGYLSNRSSKVLFQGCLSEERVFELGTPQGRVLSPTLFNVLVNALIGQIPLADNELILSYADDIMIQTHSRQRLQQILDQFHANALSCGLIISTEKNSSTITAPKRTNKSSY